MSEAAAEIRSVIVERDLPHPPEKIWRALTEGELIADWLMKTDFQLVVGHRFSFTAAWGSIECEVKEFEPNQTLSYSWGAFGLDSLVTWTLTPTRTGTHLRMEQTGFRPDQTQAYQGAKAGWPRFFAALEQLLARPL